MVSSSSSKPASSSSSSASSSSSPSSSSLLLSQSSSSSSLPSSLMSSQSLAQSEATAASLSSSVVVFSAVTSHPNRLRNLLLFCTLFFLFYAEGPWSRRLSAWANSLPECRPEDFHYEYTECDQYGGRWRVSVPEPDKCAGGTPNNITRGKDCSYTCKAGQYLDIQGNQECLPCPKGSYSLGGGIRFDSWDELPKGFYIKTEKFSEIGMLSNNEEYVTEKSNCSNSGWIPKGNFIAAYPKDCATSLVYTVNLVKPGSVTFEYQFSESASLLQFLIQNSQCQNLVRDQPNQYPPATEKGQWSIVTLHLESGMNVLFWKAFSLPSNENDETVMRPVLIRKIQVEGVAFSSECTKCRNGTYSDQIGLSFCNPCPEDTYSERGATECTSCDKVSEYSPRESGSCRKKQHCREMDYYEYQTPCNKEGLTQTKYSWMVPMRCRTDLPNATQLPPPSKVEKCPQCNPGMMSVPGSGCKFCASDEYSDGASPCQKCPVSTSPQMGYTYKWWYTMPPNITSHCLNLEETECVTNSSWIPAKSYIHTKYGPGERSYLLLVLEIPGFRGNEAIILDKGVKLGQLTFVFETNCSSQCQFYFMVDHQTTRPNVVKKWIGTQQKQKFVFPVLRNGAAKFSWIFMHSQWLSKDEDEDISQMYITDYARIHFIEVTNTISGGAASCQKCPRGTQQDGCVPCPDGHYIDVNSTKCTPCPPNTVVHSGNAWGIESCKPCGPGLHAVDGRQCISNCTYKDEKNNRHYDFESLAGFQHVIGGHLFTSAGTQYYHGFNITLCGSPDGPKAQCINNVTTLPKEPLGGPRTLSASVCRSTLVPSRDHKSLVSTQPVSLGEHLVKITSGSNMTKYFEDAGFEPGDEDIHFHYKAESPTAACQDGRETIITLRCDVKEDKRGTIDLPPKCPDGTCDGCTFHFLWRSQHACPVCREEDYDVIVSECIAGEQTIHYYPKKHCMIINDEKPTTKKKKCSSIPFAIEIGSMCALSVGLLLLCLVFYCWKKNKKLEYKYMMLVESATGEKELPAAETCALDDGEEEHFDVVDFPKDSKRKSLLKTLRSKMGSRDSSHFENIPFDHVKMPLDEQFT
ncbi:endosome/lysosome-associated apoptosis and autophagy regulator family member 2 isoform X2 [Octopus bimaculoides]|uniref:endosome/lysosome-associated apoptosis and autophagy regulator family member 2 isoform X2 n=1 Tax=Octopus bimaculoides TaxID=37653 RepID=UPI0022E0D33B|nr:endosome/lysosome-associated apoptosis and autophagy regulator family member 2 isoform X2 [Octopus bimaculoides]